MDTVSIRHLIEDYRLKEWVTTEIADGCYGTNNLYDRAFIKCKACLRSFIILLRWSNIRYLPQIPNRNGAYPASLLDSRLQEVILGQTPSDVSLKEGLWVQKLPGGAIRTEEFHR